MFAHADLELRRRFAKRDVQDHGKYSGYGFGRTRSGGRGANAISKEFLNTRRASLDAKRARCVCL